MTEEKKGKTLFDYLLFAYLVGFVLFTIIPCPWIPNFSHHGDTSSSRVKWCYANIRVLLGAAEMYNMDNKNMVTKMDERFARTLVDKGYLKEMPKCRETNSFDYCSEGDITNTGYIYCKSHGGTDRHKGEIEKKKEKTYISDSINLYFAGCFERLPQGLLWPLVCIFVLCANLGLFR